VKQEHLLACCDNDVCQRKPINNPAACWSPAIPSCEFPSIQGIGSAGGGTSQDPWIVDRIKCRIMTIHSSFQHFLPFTQCINSFTLHSFTFRLLSALIFHTYHYPPFWIITRRCRTSAPARTYNTRMSRWSVHDEDLDNYLKVIPKITLMVVMTIQNLTTSLFGDHRGRRQAIRDQKIASPQHLKHELQQLDLLLRRQNWYTMSDGMSISSRRKRMNAGLHRWHPRWYPI